jgi:hypothetical protein
MNDKPVKIEMVTLKQLCAELKADPREARERLRLAVRDIKKNPELKAKISAHIPHYPHPSVSTSASFGGGGKRPPYRAPCQ